MITFHRVDSGSFWWKGIFAMAEEYDDQFLPRISARQGSIEGYFETLRESGFTIVAVMANRIAGCISGFLNHPDYGIPFLQYICTGAELRNKGIGRALFWEAETFLKLNNIGYVRTRTWSTNIASQKVMLSRGFRPHSVHYEERDASTHTIVFDKFLHTRSVPFGGLSQLGVIGGMGPDASALFVAKVYRHQQWLPEQDKLPIDMFSRPHLPDRTESMALNQPFRLVDGIKKIARSLVHAGASHAVIACMTAHCLFDAAKLNRLGIVSLWQLALEYARFTKLNYLVLCTIGFAKSVDRSSLAESLVFMKECDQQALHEIIYAIKRGNRTAAQVQTISSMIARYNCQGIVIACTELYLIEDLVPALQKTFDVCDPIEIASFAIQDAWLKTIGRSRFTPIGYCEAGRRDFDGAQAADQT